MSNAVFDRNICIQYLPTEEENDKTKQLQAGKFLFPGFGRKLDPASKIVSGKNRYFTGLEASEYPESEREEVKQAKEELENYFGKGMLDPFNETFWKDRALEITKKATFLNMGDPSDKLTYYGIKGGLYKEVAPSYEAATGGAINSRWYLIDATQFAEIGAEDSRKYDKAVAMLVDLDESKRLEDLFLVHKALISADRGVTLRSPRGLMYKDLSDYIKGLTVKTDKKQTPAKFIAAAEQLKKDKKALYLTAYIKDGNYFNFLTVSDDNQIKSVQTGTKLGSTTDRAVKFLSNPVNQAELDVLKAAVEEKWNQ